MSEQSQAEQAALTNPQRKFLRRLGHQLNPLVIIGRDGIGEPLVEAVNQALATHELIKVKIIATSSVNKHDAAETVPRLTGSRLVQLIGKTLLLYKPNPKRSKDQRIVLPSAAGGKATDRGLGD